MNEDKVKFELRNLPIPHFFYKENRVSLIGAKVYAFIHAYTNPFFFGNEHLAEMFGCSDQAISDSIKKLEEFGFVQCEYRPKAGGGKTRLVIDLYSDYNQRTSRKNNSEATTTTGVVDKDIKENNIKENFSDLKLRPDFLASLEAKKDRKARKTPFGGSSFQSAARQPFPEKPKRKIVTVDM